jgi:hypothetical protein
MVRANPTGDIDEQAKRLVLGNRCGHSSGVGILNGIGSGICNRERTGTPGRARHQAGCAADWAIGEGRLQASKQPEQFGMP